MAQILATGSQRSGKTSRVAVGGTALAFSSYECAASGADNPTLNFLSYDSAEEESFDEGIMGALKCDVRFGGDWDASENPYDDPPGLFPRDDLANTTMFTSTIDDVDWNFPYIRLRSATNGSDVNGLVTFSCSGMNQGPFTYPGGSV